MGRGGGCSAKDKLLFSLISCRYSTGRHVSDADQVVKEPAHCTLLLYVTFKCVGW